MNKAKLMQVVECFIANDATKEELVDAVEAYSAALIAAKPIVSGWHF